MFSLADLPILDPRSNDCLIPFILIRMTVYCVTSIFTVDFGLKCKIAEANPHKIPSPHFDRRDPSTLEEQLHDSLAKTNIPKNLIVRVHGISSGPNNQALTTKKLLTLPGVGP